MVWSVAVGEFASLHLQTCAPNGPISSGGGGEADQNGGLENTHTKGHAAGGCGHFATSRLGVKDSYRIGAPNSAFS